LAPEVLATIRRETAAAVRAAVIQAYRQEARNQLRALVPEVDAKTPAGMDPLGPSIGVLRRHRSLSLRELARLSGHDRGMLARWEAGGADMRLDRVCDVLRALGVEHAADWVAILEAGDAWQSYSSRLDAEIAARQALGDAPRGADA
jgi:transcriptional regulator with XRE-family HTH domain